MTILTHAIKSVSAMSRDMNVEVVKMTARRIILWFSILAIIDGFAAPAETFYSGGVLYYSNGSGVAEVRGCQGNPISLTIPATVSHPYVVQKYDSETGEEQIRTYSETCNVRSIAQQAFSGCTGMSSIILPSTIGKIGSQAFKGCNDLSAVYISDLKAWCAISFDGYSSNPVSFAKRLFLNGSEIRNLNIPSGVTEIGAWAFCGAERIQSLSMSSDVRVIGESAFDGCVQMGEINLPSSVVEIGRSAFANCHMASRLTLSDRLDALPDSSFYFCTNLIEVTIPASVREIGENAFSYCTRMERIVIPPTVEKIGSSFKGCSNLKYATIPACGAYFPDSPIRYLELEEGWEEIDDWNFSDSQQSALETVILPASIKRIGMFAFGSCSSLKNVEIRGVAEIDHLAFSQCLNLEEVTLSTGVETIDPYWFEFTGLKKINIPAGNPYLKSVDGIVYSHDGRTLVRCPAGVERLDVRPGTTTIGRAAFYDCAHLKAVGLPSTIVEIGEFAFWRCSALTDLVFPAVLKSIKDAAFSGCEAYSEVVLPEGLEELGSGALSGCAMRTINIPTTVLNIGTGVFSDCFELERVSWPGKSVEIPDFTFCGCRSLADFEIPSQVVSIGERAFCECDVLKEIVIPATVTHIGMSAFDACTSLEFIRFMGGVPEWLPSEDGRVIEDPYLYDGKAIVALGGYGVEYKDEWEGVVNEWGLWQGLPMVCADVVPTACDWTKGEIELSWYGNDVWYRLYWSTSADPDVSTNDVRRLVRPNIMSTEEDNHRFTVKDDEYMIRGDGLQPIYYHVVGEDGSWSYCVTRRRYGLSVGFDGDAGFKDPIGSSLSEARQFKQLYAEAAGVSQSSKMVQIVENPNTRSLREIFASAARAVCVGDVFVWYVLTHGSSGNWTATDFAGIATRGGGCYTISDMQEDLDAIGSRGAAVISILATCGSGQIAEKIGTENNKAWITAGTGSQTTAITATYSLFGRALFDWAWQEGRAGKDGRATYGDLVSYVQSRVQGLGDARPQYAQSFNSNILGKVVAFDGRIEAAQHLPAAPTGLTATRTNANAIRLEWDSVPQADGYYMRWHKKAGSGDGDTWVLLDVQETVYEVPDKSDSWEKVFFNFGERKARTDFIPEPNVEYEFSIASFNSSGVGEYSTGVVGTCIDLISSAVIGMIKWYYITVAGGVSLFKGPDEPVIPKETVGDVEVPDMIEDAEVVSIGAAAFKDCSGVRSIAVSQNISSLGEDAFAGCSGLEWVSFSGPLPTGMEISRVLEYAGNVYYPRKYAAQYEAVVPPEIFAGYTDEIHVPKFICVVDNGCATLVDSGTSQGDVAIPDSIGGCPVVAIGDGCFALASNLTSVVIPESVTNIGPYAFFGCSNLATVVLHEGLVSIDSGAFAQCVSLGEIALPSSVRRVGDALAPTNAVAAVVQRNDESAQDSTNFVETVSGRQVSRYQEMSEELHEMTLWNRGWGAFDGCSALASVTLNEGLEMLGAATFRDCISLTELEVPESVVRIGGQMAWVEQDGAQSRSHAMASQQIDGEAPVVTSVDTASQRDVVSLSHRDVGFLEGCANLERVVLPQELECLGPRAFADCRVLREVDLPEHLSALDRGTFFGCTQLRRAGLPSDLEIIGRGELPYLWQWEYASSLQRQNGGLASVRTVETISAITNGVASSAQSVNGGRWSIVTAENSDMRYRPEDGVFYGCAALRELELPDSVQTLCDYSFADCGDLQLTFDGPPPTCGTNAVADCQVGFYLPEQADQWVQVIVDGLWNGLEMRELSDVPSPATERSQDLTLSGLGWHEVSFAVLPAGGDPADVFAPVEDKVGYVTYGSLNWNPLTGGTLASLEIGKGYWVQTTAENVAWTVTGQGNPDVEIALKAGWNLIGYPLTEEGEVKTVLATALATGKIDWIYSGSRVYPGTLTTLTPGKGCWVYANAAVKIRFDAK